MEVKRMQTRDAAIRSHWSSKQVCVWGGGIHNCQVTVHETHPFNFHRPRPWLMMRSSVCACSLTLADIRLFIHHRNISLSCNRANVHVDYDMHGEHTEPCWLTEGCSAVPGTRGPADHGRLQPRCFKHGRGFITCLREAEKEKRKSIVFIFLFIFRREKSPRL